MLLRGHKYESLKALRYSICVFIHSYLILAVLLQDESTQIAILGISIVK